MLSRRFLKEIFKETCLRLWNGLNRPKLGFNGSLFFFTVASVWARLKQ
jgi:hypothetical protein